MKDDRRSLRSLHVLIDAVHLEWIKTEAARRGLRVSDLIREMVEERIERNGALRSRLMSVAGITRGLGAAGKGHDSILYGPKPKRRK